METIETNQVKELKNTIKAGKVMEDITYERPKAGMWVAAFVGLKNKAKLNNFDKKNPYEQDGFQFTFRGRDNTNEFVTCWCAATANDRGKLFKLVKNMSGGKLDADITPEDLFVKMQMLMEHWFNVMIEEYKTKEGKTYAVITDRTFVTPHPQDAEWGMASKHFGVEIVTEAVSFAAAPKNDSTGFENFPNQGEVGFGEKKLLDGRIIKYDRKEFRTDRFIYDCRTMPLDKLPKFQDFVKQHNLIYIHGEHGLYQSEKQHFELKKYLLFYPEGDAEMGFE